MISKAAVLNSRAEILKEEYMRRAASRKKQKRQAPDKNLPCQKNDRAVIKIEDIGSGGEGIGFLKISEQQQDSDTDTVKVTITDTQVINTAEAIDKGEEKGKKKPVKKGFAIFVKDAVPGDTIEVTVTKVTSRYAYGHLDRILEPSPFRVQPRCPIAKTCGGCQIQALDYEKQLAFKQKKVRENLIRIGGFAAEKIDAVMHPIVGMGEPWHYRNKEQVPVQQGKYGPVTGFYASHSHTVIPMTDCCRSSAGCRRTMFPLTTKRRVKASSVTSSSAMESTADRSWCVSSPMTTAFPSKRNS